MLSGDDDHQQDIDAIDRWIKSQIRPRNLIKAETEMIKSFEELCLLIQKHGNVKAKEMTVVEFYTMLSLVKKKGI